MIRWDIDDGYRFPTITVGQVEWQAHHSVGELTDQVDGHIGPRSLDLWFVDGNDVEDLRKDYAAECARAREVWATGSVLCVGLWPSEDNGIPSLLIPGAAFTDELACAAFDRWRP